MVNFSLENKVAVITGGVQGIGLAITKAFLQNGVKTAVILDILEDKAIVDDLNSKYGPNKAIYMKCDVTKDLETISKKLFDTYTVDLLVNNAGILNEQSIRKTLEINTIAVMEWSLKFQEHMKKYENGGTIINVSSCYGFVIDQFVPVYKASKFAVMGFSRTLGHVKNFSRTKVRVIVICPGFTDTKLLNEADIGEEYRVEWAERHGDTVVQPPDAVGKAVIEVYGNAESGTAWHISDGKFVTEIN